MGQNQEYKQFVTLIEFIEKLGERHRLESVTLRNQDGNPLGALTMEDGQVRFGVQLQGRPFVDDRFTSKLPSHAAVLRKFYGRQTLTTAERKLVAEISHFQRSVFCELTARALRKLSGFCQPDTGALLDPTFGAPQPRIVNLQFWLMELMLAAGQQSPLGRDDAAVQAYLTPLDHVEERWLLEWQLHDDSLPWPVLTDRQGQRGVQSVVAYGELAQRLIPHLVSRRRHPARAHRQAELICIGDSAIYLVSTDQYLTLLAYDRSHTGRLLREMEKFIAAGTHAAPAEPASTAESPAAAADSPIPLKSATTLRFSPGLDASSPSPSRPPASPAAAAGRQRPAPPAASLPEERVDLVAGSDLAESGPAPPAAPLPPAPEPSIRSPGVQVQATEPPPQQPIPSTTLSSSRLDPAQSTSADQGSAPLPRPAAATPAPVSDDLAAVSDSSVTQPDAADSLPLLDQETVSEPPVALAEPAALPSSAYAAVSAANPLPPTAAALAPTSSVQPALSTAIPAQPQFSEPLLQLRGFTAQIDGRTVLKNVDLVLGRRAAFALMGPGGSGKSSLAAILCGRNRVASGWTFTGEILYCGSPLGTSTRPAVLAQKLAPPKQSLRDYLLAELADGTAAAYSGEQVDELLERMRLPRLRGKLNLDKDCRQLQLTRSELWLLAIARELAPDPLLLCVDEPTAGMSDEEAAPILMLLQQEARRRTILFITHNQSHAREITEYTILLAAGQLQEYRLTAEFFTAPRSKAAQDYVRTGGCYLPSPDSQVEHLSEEFTAPQSVLGGEQETAPPTGTEQTPAAAPPTTGAAPGPQSAPAGEVLWAQSRAGQRPVLSLREFTLRFGGRPIVSDCSLDIGPVGVYVLVAASGSERRLLMRALCGPRPPAMQHEGRALYCGQELRQGNQPASPQASAELLAKTACVYLTSQLPGREHLTPAQQRERAAQLVAQSGFAELSARFDTCMTDLEPPERRIFDIIRTVMPGPALLVVEEPLDGLGVDARADVVKLLAHQAQQRAVLVLSASVAGLAAKGPRCAWIVEGAVQPDEPPAPVAIEQPDKAAAVASPLPALPGAALLTPEEPTPASPSALPQAAPSGIGPRGFQWLRPGALAGMPAPGLTNDLSYDLGLIRSAGVDVLVTLTTTPQPAGVLSEHGIQSLFLPIEDMDAPTCAAAADLCGRVAALLSMGRAVGFHCKAGLGRTGTMLAAQLIWEGASAEAALAQVRTVEPNWVQSARQVSFLSQFQDWLRRRLAQTPAASRQPTQSTG